MDTDLPKRLLVGVALERRQPTPDGRRHVGAGGRGGAHVSPADRDFGRCLWGYGWGTLLSVAQTDAVGGSDRLREVPRVELLQGPGGHVWERLGDDPASVAPTPWQCCGASWLPCCR